jgi:hypothetical protein
MEASGPGLLSTFNQHFSDLLEDVSNVFPDNSDVKWSRQSFLYMKKLNPKMIIIAWKKYIYDVYKDKIDIKDFDFFVNKDYKCDVKSNSNKILEIIDRLRDPISQMSLENQDRIMQYVANLSTLSNMYNNN